MIPLKLYIENFMCFESSSIDMTQFNSALIIAKISDSEMHSNGAGKSTIFRAIEYVLFNQIDCNLEKIVRDGTSHCRIIFDVKINDLIYRISRSRNKKGTTDLSLFQRNSTEGTDNEVYSIGKTAKVADPKYWNDISGRRTSDTEEELFKLIKFNIKSFRHAIHFVQNDFTGLTTATPEKKKLLLKEALNVVIYSKLLEKVAKPQYSQISKDIDKNKTLLSNLGDPQKDIFSLLKEEITVNSIINAKSLNLDDLKSQYLNCSNFISSLQLDLSKFESQVNELQIKKSSITSEKAKLNQNIIDFSDKKTNLIKNSNLLIKEIKSIKEEKDNLSKLDFSQIQILSSNLDSKKEELNSNNFQIKNNLQFIKDLEIPIPAEGKCKSCRQIITKEHKEHCQDLNNKQLLFLKEENLSLKSKNDLLNAEIASLQKQINSLNISQQNLSSLNTKFLLKEKEFQEKKLLNSEYETFINNYKSEIDLKEKELTLLEESLSKLPIEENNKIKSNIIGNKSKLSLLTQQISLLEKELLDFSGKRAIIQNNLEIRKKDNSTKEQIEISLQDLEKKATIYQLVMQAFSSTGIPNLIIQNILDDLQLEANKLLDQLRPGLQLSFIIEKDKSGELSDTLDIKYFVNDKEREFELLSGAMKLIFNFSLKLGLSFILQKNIGANIKFLLLDELDQSLDKATIDTFAEIVKKLQKDFTILVITHNDRLKDKFSQFILVEQDSNQISCAKYMVGPC